MDAVHGGGNAHFFFLPPMVPAASYTGTFDATLKPSVDICALSNGSCASTVVTFASGTGSSNVRVDAAGQQYLVNWNTGAYTLDLNATYRIRVRVVNTEIGHSDVRLVSNGAAAKNVSTGQDIVLVDGRTLPIKFRIEKGAVAVIGNGGGTATLNDGAVKVAFAPGAVSGDAGVTATPIAPGSAQAPDASVISGTQYEFLPSPTTFAAPVTLTLTYPTTLPPRVKASRLTICKIENSACRPLTGATVDQTTHTVSAPITSFSSYAVTTLPQMAYAIRGQYGLLEYYIHTSDGDFPVPLGIGGRGSSFELAASWTPDGNTLVYQVAESPGGVPTAIIRAINWNGTNDRLLAVNASCPEVSPDGNRILFWQPNDGVAGVIDISGGGRIELGPRVNQCAQRWVPDGRISYRTGDAIWIANPDGSVPRKIVDVSGNGGLKWSADGTRVSFDSDYAGDAVGSGLYTARADGSDIRLAVPMASGGILQSTYSWSSVPGDNRIVFQSCGGLYEFGCSGYSTFSTYATGIWIVNADGTGARQLVEKGPTEQPEYPKWSPDGLRIAFEHRFTDWSEVFIMNPDGSGRQKVFLGADGFGFFPVWRP